MKAQDVRIVDSIDGLGALRGCVFVPTMGGLHEGHLSLVRLAVDHAESAEGPAPPVVVSVFVNPTQFNEQMDYERYPRDLESDARLAGESGADVIFAPPVELVYPPDASIPVPPLPPMASGRGLEDAFRPGHFEGVCQVCARLFDLLRPSVAVFGEKDWQQLQVIRRMVQDLALPIAIPGGATVREADGLAMSSRNRFLTESDRRRASAVPRAWRAAQREQRVDDAEAAMRAVLDDAGVAIEYATIRDASMLTPLSGGGFEAHAGRILIGARLGNVRLLDNAPWPV